MKLLFRDKRIAAWALFDFANTPFAVLVVTVAYAPYFKDVVAEGARSGDFLWGLASSISMAIVALTGPYSGAYADAAAAKRKLLIAYTGFTVVFTALLFTVTEGHVLRGMAFFILANVGFQGAQVFYNAFLSDISTEDNIGAVSGLGVATGYLGALVSLLGAIPFFVEDFESGNLARVRSLFLFVALFYVVFSLPTFILLKDRRTDASARVSFRDAGTGSLRRLGETLRNLRRYTPTYRFLVSYFLYMDAVTTVTAFTAIYARDTLGLSMLHILTLFLISQLTAIPGSFVMGGVADRVGPKPTITATLFLWIVLLIGAMIVKSFTALAVGALFAGLGQGSLQSVSRSMMAQLSPPGRKGEFFGFYALAGRVSAVIGPLLFGAVSSITGNQRIAIGSLAIVIAVGLLLLQRVHMAPPGTPPLLDGSAEGRQQWA